MKILFFARRFYPLIGGVEKHVLELSRVLLSQGHEVGVITESPGKIIAEKKNALPKGLVIYRIPVGKDEKRKKFEIWRWLWEHRELIKDADIVHAHDVFFWYLPFRFLYPQKPIFTTFHGYEGYPIQKKAIVVRKLSEFLSKGSICIGEFMKKWYLSYPNIISYGAVSFSNSKTKRKDTFSEGKAIFVGRLDDQTGIMEYIDAANMLAVKKIKKFSLTIYGDGPFRKRIEKKGRKVKGFVPSEKINYVSFQFAFVSRYLAMLEALAAGCIVIAHFDNPVKEDYLRMSPFANFVLIADDSEEVATLVESVISSPWKYKSMKSNGQKWAREQTWEKLTKTYQTLWDLRSS